MATSRATGGACGTEPGGKRRKKASNRGGNEAASLTYCCVSAMTAVGGQLVDWRAQRFVIEVLVVRPAEIGRNFLAGDGASH
jgi:hypothetical protein